MVGVRMVYSAAPSPRTVPSTQFHKYVSEQSPVLLGDTSQATVTSKVEVRRVFSCMLSLTSGRVSPPVQSGICEQPSLLLSVTTGVCFRKRRGTCSAEGEAASREADVVMARTGPHVWVLTAEGTWRCALSTASTETFYRVLFLPLASLGYLPPL